MKTVSACVLGALSMTFAAPAMAAEAGPAPTYVALFSVPVNVLLGCYTNGRTLMTATPTGNGFVIRRKGENSALLLTDQGLRSRAELYISAEGPSRAMRQVLRACDMRALTTSGAL